MVAFSGHMTDAPDRGTPRFPASQEAAVRKAIDAALYRWGIGPGDLCLSSGARGGDLIFAERCLERGARVRLLLPLPLEDFLARSVRDESGVWERRFRAVARRAEVRLTDDRLRDGHAGSPFAWCNDWLLATAEMEAAPGTPRVLVVWDGRAGGGTGGTDDLAAKAEGRGWPVTVIDPREPLRS